MNMNDLKSSAIQWKKTNCKYFSFLRFLNSFISQNVWRFCDKLSLIKHQIGWIFQIGTRKNFQIRCFKTMMSGLKLWEMIVILIHVMRKRFCKGRRLSKTFFSLYKDKFCYDLTYLLQYDILQQYVKYLLQYDIL